MTITNAWEGQHKMRRAKTGPEYGRVPDYKESPVKHSRTRNKVLIACNRQGRLILFEVLDQAYDVLQSAIIPGSLDSLILTVLQVP